MASAVWKGGLRTAGDAVDRDGVLSNAPYGFKARFEDGPGTNPEELLGAAHAGCFSMALSAQLGEARMIAESISTIATVTLDKSKADSRYRGPPGSDREDTRSGSPGLRGRGQQGETGCPLSKVLKAKITLDAKLEA